MISSSILQVYDYDINFIQLPIGIVQELQSSEQERDRLQAELCQVKKEKEELVKRCHTLKSLHDASSDKCQKTMSVLKDSEKRQRETSNKNEELMAEIQDLRRQVIFERESKQKHETDTEKLRDDNRRLEEDKRKLEVEKGALAQEKQKLENEVEHLKNVNNSLEIQNNKLTESNHKMQRANSDLSQQIYQMHRQQNSKNESDPVAALGNTLPAQAASPLQEHSDLHSSQGLTMTCTPTPVSSVEAIKESS